MLHAAGYPYLWHPARCPSCCREYKENQCHLCKAAVFLKSWTDFGMRPPPPGVTTSAIETLAGRCVTEQRLSLAEMDLATRDDKLSARQRHLTESLVRSYASGLNLERRRRMDRSAEESQKGRRR